MHHCDAYHTFILLPYTSPMAMVLRLAHLQVTFWSVFVGRAWNSLRLDEQVIYLYFAIQTIAILTLFELMLLK